MAPRKKKPPPSPNPKDDFTGWLKHELLIAVTVAASLTVVLVVRRWATELLGTKLMNAEVFGQSGMLEGLIGAVERRYQEGERHGGTRRRAGPDRPAGEHDLGGRDDERSDDS